LQSLEMIRRWKEESDRRQLSLGENDDVDTWKRGKEDRGGGFRKDTGNLRNKKWDVLSRKNRGHPLRRTNRRDRIDRSRDTKRPALALLGREEKKELRKRKESREGEVDGNTDNSQTSKKPNTIRGVRLEPELRSHRPPLRKLS